MGKRKRKGLSVQFLKKALREFGEPHRSSDRPSKKMNKLFFQIKLFYAGS